MFFSTKRKTVIKVKRFDNPGIGLNYYFKVYRLIVKAVQF